MVDRVLVEHTEELFLDSPAHLASQHHATEGAEKPWGRGRLTKRVCLPGLAFQPPRAHSVGFLS
jgi:hypothetical protein